ncbi:MAG: hypothetical protein IJH77_05200 [Mogibacterium sp.]|nr:hypothetical protein [Mogibacterium sp.]
MSVKDIVEQKVGEIENAADKMMPIEDLHLGAGLRKIASEIDHAQEVMLRLPTSDKDRLRAMCYLYVDRDSRPVVFCGMDRKVLYANAAAAAKFGEARVAKSAEFAEEELEAVLDAGGSQIGFIAK